MSAGLECHIHMRSPCAIARLSHCYDLGMRLAGTFVEALADDLSVAHDDASDERIGGGGATRSLSKRQSARKIRVVDP